MSLCQWKLFSREGAVEHLGLSTASYYRVVLFTQMYDMIYIGSAILFVKWNLGDIFYFIVSIFCSQELFNCGHLNAYIQSLLYVGGLNKKQ